MGRAPCCDKSKVKRGPWSAEEDNTLKNYLHEHGTTGSNWITLPTKAGLNRCGKSCRLRWMNYLRPDIKRGSFTEEEDIAICNLFSRIGSRWSVIASQLPGRTDNDVKNYWNTKLKKKLARNNIVTTRKTSDHNIALFSAPVPAEVVTPNGAPETASSCLGNTSTLPYAANIGLMHGFNQPKQAFAPWCDHFSDSRPMEVSDFGSTSDSNSFSVPLSHQEVSSLPCSSSNLAHQLDEYYYSLWSGYEDLNSNSEFLMGFGFESPPSDHFLQGDFGYWAHSYLSNCHK